MTKRTGTLNLKASGQTVTVAMPRLYQLLASHAKAPNPLAARIVQLLEGYSLATKQSELEAYNLNTLLGAMELASLMLVHPRLVLDRDPEEGEVGPDAFAQADWGELLAWFRRDPEQADPAPAGDNQP